MNLLTLGYSMFRFALEYMEDSRIRKSRLSVKSLSKNLTAMFRSNKTKSENGNHVRVSPVVPSNDDELGVRQWD